MRSVKRQVVGDHEWVESLHSGSELPNYDTYYMATTTSNLGILVTMSVHKDSVDRYVAQLRDMIRTLIVYQR
jgi:hypothetical protein